VRVDKGRGATHQALGCDHKGQKKRCLSDSETHGVDDGIGSVCLWNARNGCAHSNKKQSTHGEPARTYVSLEEVFVAVRATELQSLLAGLLKHKHFQQQHYWRSTMRVSCPQVIVALVSVTVGTSVAAYVAPPPPPPAAADGCALPECVRLTGDAGNVEGALSDNGAFVAFRGIPFGQPPVGVLRWDSPRPATEIGKGNTLDVKTFKPNCAQSHDGGVAWETLTDSFSEDCLYLNVWMPWSEQEALPKMPVCVYIHGGGYAWGGANDRELDGSFFAEIGDCVAVTIQYRLGVFGFLGHNQLRAGDNTTGNWGIQDQRLALKWVHDNIEAFNGDPKQVLIFGESAGAAGVSNHVAMKRSWPYFTHAAMQSGGFQEWAAKSEEHAEANAETFFKNVGCSSAHGSAELRRCLEEASDTAVIAAASSGEYPHEDSWSACRWAPVIDGVELSDHPNKLLERGAVHPTAHLIMGTNQDEGTDFIGYTKTGFLDPPLPSNLTEAEFRKWASVQFGEAVVDKVVALYPVPRAHPTYWVAAQNVVGDYMMACPNRRFARHHALTRPGNTTYVYWFAELPGTIPKKRGVFHGADIRFVFFNVVYLTGWDEKDLGLDMNRFWSNMAASGSPNMRGNEVRVRPTWPPVNATTESSAVAALYFEAAGVEALADVHPDQCIFWDTQPPV
jgi:carboxylesterase type B